jgi:hypothetical protein
MEVKEKKQVYTEKEYRKAEGINYSLLSAIDRDPKSTLRETQPTDAMTKGSVVDCLLTNGDFDKDYYVMEEAPPKSAQMLAYIEAMLKEHNHARAQKLSGYQNEVSQPKWEKEGKPYYTALAQSRGKTVISYDDYTQCMSVANTLRSNRYTSFAFREDYPDYIDIKDQLIIFFDVNGNKCKAMLDKVYIHHEDREISPIDIKTTGKSVKQFQSSYLSFRYYIQAAFYTEAIRQWADANGMGDYKILPFTFIVAEMADYNAPMLYEVSEKDLFIGQYGGRTKYGNPVKGYLELIDALQWHRTSDQYDYSRDVYRNAGVTELNSFE